MQVGRDQDMESVLFSNPYPFVDCFIAWKLIFLSSPITSSGNQYLVVFLNYLTKWVEVYPVPDQQAETITRLLVENIVSRHGVLEELLSYRGVNFLSDLILQMCSLLDMKKVNMSGYISPTDGWTCQKV